MGALGQGEKTQVSPPDATYVRARWIARGAVDWAKDCDQILMDYGMCVGTVRRSRGAARWHAQKLIRLLVELRMHERWELVEHTERQGDGWIWSVEYVGNNSRRVNFR